MNAEKRAIPRMEKPGRLELAIREWQRQLMLRREAQITERAESDNSAGTASGIQVLRDHSAAA